MVGDEPVQRVLAPDLDSGRRDRGGGAGARLRPPGRGSLAAVRAGARAAAAGADLRGSDAEEETETVLLAVHHIVADFASLAVMARELVGALPRRRPAAAARAAATPTTSHWQAGVLAGPRGERLWEYWRQRLAGVRDLDLPADRPRPPVQTWRGGARAAAIPPALVAALRELASPARRHAVHDAARRLLGAARPLHRAGGLRRRRAGGGAAAAGAGAAWWATSSTPSPCGPTSPASRASRGCSERTRQAALEGMEHGELPFPLRRRAAAAGARSGPARRSSRPCWCSSRGAAAGAAGARRLLAGGGRRAARARRAGARIGARSRSGGRSSISPCAWPSDGGGGLGVSLEHNADLFDGATAERMLGHFLNLLQGAAAAPEAPVWHLPLLAPAERRQAVGGGTRRRRATDAVSSCTSSSRRRRRARRTPRRWWRAELRLTYGEMNAPGEPARPPPAPARAWGRRTGWGSACGAPSG